MKKIVVVGAGPRGIAIVLQALSKGFDVTVIDDRPLYTWSYPFLIEDMEMRSPITFDLVSYIPELYEFSLAKYLGYSIPPTTDQRFIESCAIKVHRREFYRYMQFLWEYLLPKVTFIPERITAVTPNQVILSNQILDADAIVITTGCERSKNPEWMQYTNIRDKVSPLSDLIKADTTNAKVAVVGSGQGAAETVYFLASKGNQVYWCLKHNPQVSQYPAPAYDSWGYRSALGGYYRRTLTNWRDRLSYLGKVKAWQPTITPYIHSKLQTVKYTQITPTSSDDLQPIFEADYVINSTGFNPDASELPCTFEVEREDYLPQFPRLKEGFRIPGTHIHISGILAIGFDGGRQASLISAGLTAKEIMENIS